MRFVLLDSTPLGLAAHPTQQSRIEPWLRRLPADGSVVCLPEIIYFEVRRELERLRLVRSLALLEDLRLQLRYLPLDTSIIVRASILWAEARRAGRPTAHASDLDIDVILAATALELAERERAEVVVATANIRHLAQFVDARAWETIV